MIKDKINIGLGKSSEFQLLKIEVDKKIFYQIEIARFKGNTKECYSAMLSIDDAQKVRKFLNDTMP